MHFILHYLMQAVGGSELTKINFHGGQLMFHLDFPTIQIIL